MHDDDDEICSVCSAADNFPSNVTNFTSAFSNFARTSTECQVNVGDNLISSRAGSVTKTSPKNNNNMSVQATGHTNNNSALVTTTRCQVCPVIPYSLANRVKNLQN